MFSKDHIYLEGEKTTKRYFLAMFLMLDILARLNYNPGKNYCGQPDFQPGAKLIRDIVMYS